jgi:hypothetical protein
MKRTLMAAITLMAVSPACAGDKTNATAISGSQSNSASLSASKASATAIGNRNSANAQGGTGVGVGTGGNVNIAGAPAQTAQTITQQGSTSVTTVPSVFAPGLAAAGIESCLGSVSGGGSWLGTGITLGGSIPDLDCTRRLDARTLWSFGLREQAVARMCDSPANRRVMPDICARFGYAVEVAPGPASFFAPAPAVYAPEAGQVPNSDHYSGSLQQGAYYSDPSTYRGGPIMLTDGRTGQERLCNNYDLKHTKCRAWDGVQIAHSSPRPKQMAAKKSAPIRTDGNPAVASAPVN